MNPQNNIQFDSDQTSAMTALYNKNKSGGRSGIAKFLISKGIVKDEKSATKFLIGFAVIILLVAAYLFYSATSAVTVNPVGGI